MNYLIAILSILIPILSFSQNEAAETLAVGIDDARQIAYDNNLTLKDQNLDVQIAKSQLDQTLADGLPQINASFDYQWNILNAFAERTGGDDEIELPPIMGEYNLLEQTATGSNGNFSPTNITDQVQGVALESIGGFFGALGDAFVARHTSNAGISVNQKVFDGVYLLGIEATKVFVELSEVQLEPTKRDIDKAVEKAYYGILITQENMDIIQRNQQNLSELIHETKEIYKAGFAEQLDVDRLELSLAILENSRKNLVKIEQLNYDVLKNAMNVPLNTNLDLTDSIEEFEAYALGDDILAEVANPDLWPEFQILDVQEKIQGLDIERLERGKLPKVDAFLNGGYNYQGNDFIFTNGFDNWFPNVAAGIRVSMPVFDGNRRNYQIQQKQLEMEKIKLSRETLQTGIDIQIESALTAFTNARIDIESQKENIALAEKIYNVTQIKYREGVGSSLELYQAQQDLYSAQQAYINSLYNLLIAKVDLEQAAGK